MKDVLVPSCSDLRHSTCRPCYVVLILLLPLARRTTSSVPPSAVRASSVASPAASSLTSPRPAPLPAVTGWACFENCLKRNGDLRKEFSLVTSPKMHSYLQTKQWRFSCVTWTCQQFRWFLWWQEWQEWQDWQEGRATAKSKSNPKRKAKAKAKPHETRCRSWSYRWSRQWTTQTLMTDNDGIPDDLRPGGKAAKRPAQQNWAREKSQQLPVPEVAGTVTWWMEMTRTVRCKQWQWKHKKLSTAIWLSTSFGQFAIVCWIMMNIFEPISRIEPKRNEPFAFELHGIHVKEEELLDNNLHTCVLFTSCENKNGITQFQPEDI